MLKLSDQSKKNLEQEITGYKDEAQKMRKVGVFFLKISSFLLLKKTETTASVTLRQLRESYLPEMKILR